MNRADTFKLRVSDTERQLITAVAQQLDRTESDTIRLLVKERARDLGLLSSGINEGRPRLSQQSALREA